MRGCIFDEMERLAYAITLNWNSINYTAKWADSILASDYANLKVLVVDNGFSHDSYRVLNELSSRIEIIKNSENLGASGGFNVGIKAALKNSADYIFISNNDTYIDRECLSRLISFVRNKRGAGLVAPKIYLEGTKVFYTAGAPSIYYPFGTRGYGQPDVGQFDKPKRLEWTLSTGLLVSKRVFEKVGFFDEDYFIYFEDFDFSRRAYKAGFDIWYCPDAVMWHKPKQSTGLLSNIQVYYSTRNALLVTRKVERENLFYSFLACIFTVVKFPLVIALSLAKGDISPVKYYFLALKDFFSKRLGKCSQL